MKKYKKPIIEEEIIELEDIIAASPTDPMSAPAEDYDPNNGDSIGL